MRRASLVLLGLAVPSAGWAQQGSALEAAVLSDHRVRGLSWSDGKAAPQLFVEAPVAGGLSVSAEVTGARKATRHGGADAAVTVAATYRADAGLLRWHAGVTGQVFPGGAGDQDYAEIDGGVAGTLGPLDLGLTASYAPDQAAIGGSNLHLGAAARVALVGTPVTVIAGLGRSSGKVDDPLQAARLRPGGAYVDWSLGGRYVMRRLSVSLTYSDTDIAASDVPAVASARNFGAKIVAGIHLTL